MIDSTTPGFQIGEVARLLDVPRRRVDGWVRRGWLFATNVGRGTGHAKRVSSSELGVARRVVRIQRELGVQASEILFAATRARLASRR